MRSTNHSVVFAAFAIAAIAVQIYVEFDALADREVSRLGESDTAFVNSVIAVRPSECQTVAFYSELPAVVGEYSPIGIVRYALAPCPVTTGVGATEDHRGVALIHKSHSDFERLRPRAINATNTFLLVDLGP